MSKSNLKLSKWMKGVVFVFLLALYASFQIVPIDLPAADDLPRMIKNGEDILQGNFDVLTKNVYSYTEPEHRFANHHWLFGVTTYFLERTVGYDGIVIFKILMLLLAFSMLFWVATKKADFWLVAALAVPTILMLEGRTRVRPEIFSYLFIAIYLWLLFDLEEHPERKRIFWLVPLQLLWVNLHLYFGIGILMAAGFLLEKYLRRRELPGDIRSALLKKLSILCLLLIAVSFLSPFGIGGAIYALSVNIGKDFPVGIAETRSFAQFLTDSSLTADLVVALFIPLLVIAIISFFFGLERKPVFYFLAVFGAAILSFRVLRALPLFAFMFLPAVSANFQASFQRLKQRLEGKRVWHGILAVCLLLVIGSLAVFDVQEGRAKTSAWDIGLANHSEEAAKFIKENNIHGPIYNDPDIGSYLIYSLYPQEKVFVDNRFGDGYSAEFFRRDVVDAVANDENWHALEERYQFNAMVLYQYNQGTGFRDFLYRRAYDPAWSMVYGDNYVIIFLKANEQNQEIIGRFAIKPENSEARFGILAGSHDWGERVAAGDLYRLIGRVDLAKPIYEQAVAERPNQYPVWVSLAELEIFYLGGREPHKAIEYLERAIAEGDPQARTRALLGFVYNQTDQPDKAEYYLRQALDIDPETPNARELLKEMGLE